MSAQDPKVIKARDAEYREAKVMGAVPLEMKRTSREAEEGLRSFQVRLGRRLVSDMMKRGNIEGLARLHDEIHVIITSAKERLIGENHDVDQEGKGQ